MYNTLDELEDVCSNLELFDTVLWESTEEHQLALDGYHVYIPQLNVNVYPALWLTYYEEDSEFIGDFEIYLFFPAGANEYGYSEGYSCLQSAIQNYMHFSKAEVSLDDLTYEIIENVAVSAPTFE